jgi:hypothetical protein
MDHIEYLSRFVPFKAGFQDIVTELQEDPGIAIETKAIKTVKGLCRTGKGLVILTGNAGHGKTFICREILFDFLGKDRGNPEDIAHVINKLRGESISSEGVEVEDKTLIIHKDLSDIGIESAAELLQVAFQNAEEQATLVCINEGRLREVITKIPEAGVQGEIRNGLKSCIEKGVASQDPKLTFINMNFQSVTANRGEEGSILEDTLIEWIDKDERWKSCPSCGEQSRCPIYRNRELLKSENAKATRRRSGIIFLFRLAELYGHPTTIREMLMLLGYIITGGLTCQNIRSNNSGQSNGEWQSEYAFHQLIFGDGKSNYELNQLPLLKRLRFFDPAKSSRRSADDRYVVGVEGLGEDDSDLAFEFSAGNATEVRDAHKTMQGGYVEGTGSETGVEEAGAMTEAARLLRRRDFFDLWQIEGDPAKLNEERSKRLGLQSYTDFILALGGNAESGKEKEIKKRLVSGFHAVQGISPWFDFGANKLFLLHSAFIRLSSSNSPVNSDVKLADVHLSPEPAEWSSGEGVTKVSDTCDWEPVNLYLSIDGRELTLNLERYSYLLKASDGYFARSFYGSDVRRIQNYLAALSDVADSGGDDTLRIMTENGIVEYELDEERNTIDA